MHKTTIYLILTVLSITDSFNFEKQLPSSFLVKSRLFASKKNRNNDVATSGASTRRKMGPPQRQLDKKEEGSAYGRVSVYCVGASIDLQALRAHVFRRNFGNQDVESPGARPELALTRGEAGVPTSLDNEVLHVSNAPLFISANDTYRRISPLQWSQENDVWSSFSSSALSRDLRSQEMGSDEEDEGVVDPEAVEELWRSRETLLMATQDIFYFDYGCVVFWGLTPREEKAAMTELATFTSDPVSPKELDDSFDTMQFIFDRKANPQRPIKFDRMRLRSLQIEEKLALSYAMAQSSKLFVFESKVLQSVEQTRYLPRELAIHGKIKSSKKELNQLIGQLFVQQTEVNLFSSILDQPGFLWDDDEHNPTYQYTRSYLEVDDRVELLNSRLTVIRDLLDVLNAQVADSNSNRLEWIVIWLISVEIIMGLWSNPLFAGKRVLTALLVPTVILAYKKINWSILS